MYRKIIYRVLKILKNVGAIKEVHKLTYEGKGVSLNKFYSQGHWSTRHRIKTSFRIIFQKLVDDYGNLPWMDEFSVLIFYNSRHDPDNVVGMEKLLIDFLKQDVDKNGNIIKDGYLKDDSKRYYKGLMISPDTSLPNNTFEFILISH